MATVEVALPWVALAAEEVAHLMAQAADDLQWEALVQAVDVLRWVDQETDLHLLEGRPSHKCSGSPLMLKSPSGRSLMIVSST